ncbi:DUF1580 domain-containing protein [Anatilimnocola floriformis]|uniref:DUF1580 domain-containing protein n=1 Tax=Anatilimnocola floriformis TaxID=2948575 RepID=UPI0020C3446A|nr:DUF1580 domain-containing protein [Anatilimnocola floriformis]
MPSDLLNETLVTFAEVAKRIPSRRRGRPVHISSIHRYRSPGIDDVKLEAVRVGGTWMTSLEAFSRFCAALTAAKGGSGIGATGGSRGDDGADRELESSGW